jgi:hypothetical protein
MKLFNWINPLWIMDNFLTTYFDPISATAATTAASQALPAVAAPSILGGGLTGAGMMTSSQLPGLMAASTPGLLSGLGTLGGATQAAGLGLNIYDRMNPSQAPLQPSAMQSAQQLIGQRQAVPTPEFNSMLQLPRKPIYIG